MKTSQWTRTGMKRLGLLAFVPCLSVFLGTLPLANGVEAQGKGTGTLSIATDRIGTTFNAFGSGIAKVVSQYSPMTIVVRPFSGPDAWLAALNQGEMNLGAVSSPSTWLAYHAKAAYKEPLTNLRLLRSGEGSLLLSFVVPAKSNIRSVKDLKGKRVSSSFGGHATIVPQITSALEAAGLKWSDVVPIPVVSAADAVQALMEGRLDASWASFGMPQVRQADARIGVRYIPLESSPQALEVYRRIAFPDLQIRTVKAGSAPGVIEDTVMMTPDSYLIANAKVSDEAVRAILSALWDHEKDLIVIHPGLKNFTNRAAVTELPSIPYHPEAVRFYKEKGLWNSKAEAAQKKLLP